MLDLLDHRGPDYRGHSVSKDGRCLMGNTRLAIVDPDSQFPVPMVVGDSEGILSFNGEIYNHQHLKLSLKRLGARFYTGSDTEVLCEGLRLKGKAIQNELDGIWAFSYYDESTRSLLLSRDLMGEKHLFYTLSETELVFASEPAPVLAASLNYFSVDPVGVTCSWLYTSTQPGRTLIRELFRLEPGHNLIMDAEGNFKGSPMLRLSPEKWMSYFETGPTQDDVVEIYRDMIETACASRVPDEVDYFATLSGGVDSNIVVSFSSENGVKPINTIHGTSTQSSPSRGGDLSEIDAARFTSQKLGSVHEEFSMASMNPASELKAIASNSFSGLVDPGTVAFQLVAKRVRQCGAKVVLFSDGPDELLGGYVPDAQQFMMHHSHRSSILWPKIQEQFNNNRWFRSLWERLGQRNLPHPFDLTGTRFRPIHQRSTIFFCEKFFGRQAAQEVDGSYGRYPAAYESLSEGLDFGQKMALSYAVNSLPDHFNLRSDIGTMFHSVENRLPLQAPSLVELMVATPSKFRFGGAHGGHGNLASLRTKHLLRVVLGQRLGPKIAERNKYGFAANIWMEASIREKLGIEDFQHSIQETCSELLSSEELNHHLKELEINDDLVWFWYSVMMTKNRLEGFNKEFST